MRRRPAALTEKKSGVLEEEESEVKCSVLLPSLGHVRVCVLVQRLQRQWRDASARTSVHSSVLSARRTHAHSFVPIPPTLMVHVGSPQEPTTSSPCQVSLSSPPSDLLLRLGETISNTVSVLEKNHKESWMYLISLLLVLRTFQKFQLGRSKTPH